MDYLGIGLLGFFLQTRAPDERPGAAEAREARVEYRMDELVITATKRETSRERIGASVTVLDGEEIEKRQARDLLEHLRDVPGFSVAQIGSRGGRTSLFVRGGEPDHNLVMIDGIQVNRGGGEFDFANLTTDAIERVEIVRGPLSALYGSDALASAINIITKRGSGPPQFRLVSTGGSFGTTEEHLQASGGAGSFGYSLGVGRYDTDGLNDFNNEAKNTSVRARGDWDPTDRVRAGVTASFIDSRFNFPTDFVPGTRGGFPPVDPNQGRETQELALGLDASASPVAWWEHRLQVGVADFENRSFDELDPIPSDRARTDTRDEERRISTDYRQLFDVPLAKWATSVLTFGFEFEPETFDQVSERVPREGEPSRTTADQSRTTFAYYSQAEVGLWERLFVTFGGRIDDNSEFGTEFTPLGSVAYLIPVTGTRLRGSAGRGFKAPTFRENFGSAFVSGNPDLDPERSLSWEAGADQRFWDGRVEASAAYFRTEFDDLIAFAGPFGDPSATFQNIQEARSQGVELALQVDVATNLRGGLAYTFLDTEVIDGGGLEDSAFVEGKELLRRPRHSGSFWVGFDWKDLSLTLSGTGVGSRADRDFGTFPETRVRNPGYVKLDLAASYLAYVHPVTGAQLKLRSLAQNLLDDDYEEAFGFESPGINIVGGIELKL